VNERFLEAVGPIVVKEVRQGLRARVFAICFGLLLLACLITSLVAAADNADWDRSSLGPQYLTLFLSGLSLVCFFVIPYTAYRSMAREREDETWVLLALTGLSSRRIVRGKVASALTQAILYSSAGAPFILFSYFLNGVDLPTLLVEITFASVWAVFVTSVAVALGTEGHSRLGRSLVHFLVLGLLGAGTFSAIAFGANLARKGAYLLNEDGFVIFCCIFPVVVLATAVLVLEGAAAGLSLASEATAKGPRLVILSMLVVAIMGTYLGVSFDASSEKVIAPVASVFCSLFLVGFGFFAVSGPDGRPRSQQEVTWLTAGALRGWKLTMGLLILQTIAWAGLFPLIQDRSRDDRMWNSIFAAPLYVGLYLSMAVVVGRITPLRKLGHPVATRLGFLGLVASAAVFFPVLAVITGDRANDRGWNLLNPIFGMVNYLERLDGQKARLGLVLLVAGWTISSLIAWFILKRKDGARIG
jgi:ABC-type transport system involved in multi-copper enzyme maturation permease subunit